jgi:hypothetical protein
MAVGFFIDKSCSPSAEELKAALGGCFPLWEALLRFIEDTYQLRVEFSYGGKNYGWNLWYRPGGKALVSLYPQQDSFVAQVVLGKDQLDKALRLSLGEKVGKMVRETPLLHDGKWLFIPVDSQADLQDVQQLLLVKKRPVKKKLDESM